MSKEQIRFVSLGIQSYAKIDKKIKPTVIYPVDVAPDIKSIDPDGGVFLILPKGFNVALLEGDQGEGKTSILKFLAESFAAIEAPENAVNTIDQDKKGKTRIYGKDGNLYEIRLTKSTLVVEEIVTEAPYGEIKHDEKGREIKKEMKTPKAFIKKTIGPAGIDPNTLKNMSGAEQVQWVRSLFSLSTESLTREVENNKKRKEAYDKRTGVNRDLKFYTNLVEQSPYSTELEKWEEHFNSTVHDNVETEISETQKKFTEYQAFVAETEQLKQQKERSDVDIKFLDQDIEELERKLALMKNRRIELGKANDVLATVITEREAMQNEKKAVVEENEKAVQKLTDANEFRNKKKEFEAMKENKRKMDELSKEATSLTATVDECDKWKEEFVRSFTPQIAEMELCIPDDKETREGIFFRGASSNKWSESEAWEVAIAFWEELNIRIVFVENVSSLGSAAIEKLNYFANNGGYVFGSLMNRAEKNLKITISNQLPQ
jgi:hypothetical protein